MLPSRLLNPPIADATIEIRFSSDYPADAVFGIIYRSIRESFSKSEKMPILELPDEIRSKDPSLQFQPYYRLINDDYVLQIGPRMVSLSPSAYPGWTTFSAYAADVFSRVLSSGVAVQVTRIGLRFINGFPERNILPDLNMDLRLLGKPHDSPAIYLRTLVEDKAFASTLQIANGANFVKGRLSYQGSVVDIDTYSVETVSANPKAIEEVIANAHSLAKQLFFGLLSDRLLKELEPVYES